MKAFEKAPERQLEAILSDIYDLSKSIQAMLSIDHENTEQAAMLASGARALASQIAWMADLAAGGEFEGADFEKATFPVTSVESESRQEVDHG